MTPPCKRSNSGERMTNEGSAVYDGGVIVNAGSAVCNDTVAAKQALRRAVMARTRAFCADSEAARNASAAACACVQSLRAFAEAAVVLAYMPMPTEIDCTALIAAALARGKQVALPRVVRTRGKISVHELDFYVLAGGMADADRLMELLAAQTECGAYGIREPKTALRQLELGDCESIFGIVPGVAFTARGARLGHGNGYYDRYLARLQRAAQSSSMAVTTCGLCFAAQLTDAVPCVRHDVLMDYVATERGILRRTSPATD